MEMEACLRAGGSRGMDVPARCDREARTYPASEFSYRLQLRWGVLFPKLSKLLNQGDALSAPCFSRAGLTRHF
jgi:hypothetical protein